MENIRSSKDKAGRNAVFGIFGDRASLENAVDSFKANGFRNSDISVLMQSPSQTKDFAHEKSTKAPEGATAGGTAGILTGGVLGWLAGIGALAIPGIGPFVAAGPIMGAIAGIGIGGAVGGIAGGLIGMGFPEYEAKRYEGYVKDGGILISVHVDDSDWEDKAKNILESCGAKDISTMGEKKEDITKSMSEKSEDTTFTHYNK
ncbi:MAG: DUF3341 domain-containing protein [Oligoflexia bacterium]|nr:DUF3341 domain-containing protein [Oligoflexia bacterium]